MKDFAIKIAVVFAILMAALVLWQLREIVVLVLVSFAIAAAMRAPIDLFMRRGMRRGLAMAISYAAVLLVVAGLLFIVGTPLTDEFAMLGDNVVTAYTRLQEGRRVFGPLDTLLADRLPTIEQLTEFATGDQMQVVGESVLAVTQSVGAVIGQFLLALVLSIYWTADQVRFERFWLSLLPAKVRPSAREVWHDLERQIGAYLRSEVTQSILAMLLIGPGLWLLGVSYPMIWALLIALAWFVPLVGGLIFLIPLWLAAWFSAGAVVATGALLYVVAVLALMELVVERRLISHTRYTSVLMILVMLALVSVAGIVGLLVAPLLAITIEVIISKIAERPVRQAASQPATALVGVALLPDVIPDAEVFQLEKRLEEVRGLLPNSESPSTLRLASLADRLHHLLKEAEEL